jgi:hypothetical protein
LEHYGNIVMLDRLLSLEVPARVAGVALLLLAAFALGRCDGARREAARQEAVRATAVVEAMGRNAAAHAQASDARSADSAAFVRHKKELIDAIQAIPDTHPDPVRVALGCQRLRAQGRRDADLPAVCRSQGGAQAGGAR